MVEIQPTGGDLHPIESAALDILLRKTPLSPREPHVGCRNSAGRTMMMFTRLARICIVTLLGTCAAISVGAEATTATNAAVCPASWKQAVAGQFPIGIWYDGRVQGINVPEGCTNVPAGQKEAREYYLKTFRDIRDHGISIVVIPNTPPDYRETLLKAADEVGVKIVLEIAEVAWPQFGGDLCVRNTNLTTDSAVLRERLGKIINPIRHHPSLYAYQLIDEPPAEFVPGMQRISAALARLDPKRPGFSCMCNEGELSKTADSGTPMVIFDRYPIRAKSKPGDYDMQQWVKLNELIRKSADARSIPYWMVMQTFGMKNSVRMPTPAEVSALTWIPIAHNCKGIFYFLYNSDTQGEHLQGVVDSKLNPDPMWKEVGEQARAIKALSPLLAELKPAESALAAEPAGKIDAQTFADGKGRKYLIVVNMDVTAPVKWTVELANKDAKTLTAIPQKKQIKTGADKDSKGFPIELAAGQGQIYRID